MPALNIDFSEEELAELRATAHERGVTLKGLVREAVTGDLDRHRALARMTDVLDTFVRENAAAFDEAFPEDAPTAEQRRRRGAA